MILKIEARDVVVNQDGITGHVLETDPYQILSDGRKYHNFILENGSSSVCRDIWLTLDTIEAFTFDEAFVVARAILDEEKICSRRWS